MTGSSTAAGRNPGWQRRALMVSGALLACCVSVSACGILTAAKRISTAVHDISGGNAALNAWEKQVKSGEGQKYSVTYETTGKGGGTITFASDPPHDFAYTSGASDGNSATDFVEIGSTSYDCTQPSGGKWGCEKLSGALGSASEAGLFDLYTGAYWLTFLKYYEAAAALEGVTIKNTTMNVNSFPLSCVVIDNSKDENNGGTFCVVTATGVLGYIHNNSSPTSDFEIKTYTSSPASSLFQVPAGATVSTVPT